MASANKSITARIDWCRWLSTQACAPLEIAEWRAEAEGLEDALLHRDHTTQYQQGSPSVFERYALGLQDGQAVLRTAAVYLQSVPPTRTTTTGRYAGINCMGNMSSSRIMGLTRRAETDVHASRVTGNDKKIMGRVRAT